MAKLKDISPVQQDQFQQGLIQLESRRNKMWAYMVLSLLVALMSLVTIFFNQQLIYAFFEISPTIQQLHVPYTAQEIQQRIGENPDYFGQLFFWVMWLGLKMTSAFIGAILLVYYAKKLKFIRQKLKGFVQTILAWMISFILIWLGLTWVQSEIIEIDRQNQRYAEVVEYKSNIQQSKLYRYIERSDVAAPVQHYLLAQAALLHRPIDRDTAIAYNAMLVQEEKQNPRFIEYGFKPEQLWAMQQQLYGKSVTTMAQSVQSQVDQANRVAYYTQWLLLGLLAVFAALTLIFYMLNRQFTKRLERIDGRLLKDS